MYIYIYTSYQNKMGIIWPVVFETSIGWDGSMCRVTVNDESVVGRY